MLEPNHFGSRCLGGKIRAAPPAKRWALHLLLNHTKQRCSRKTMILNFEKAAKYCTWIQLGKEGVNIPQTQLW